MMEQQRPPRPNSIEIRRSYQQEMPDGIPSPAAYPPYEENPYQHGMYGQGPLSSESLNMAGGTPTRGKARPSQPPPAPPSNTSTPSANTPTRGKLFIYVLCIFCNKIVVQVAVCPRVETTCRRPLRHLRRQCRRPTAFLPTWYASLAYTPVRAARSTSFTRWRRNHLCLPPSLRLRTCHPLLRRQSSKRRRPSSLQRQQLRRHRLRPPCL